MKKQIVLFLGAIILLSSCLKEYSAEQSTNGTDVIIGADCRINKIAFVDSATGIGKGSISAIIDASDNASNITLFDSLSLSVNFSINPQYFNDTVAISTDEYFIRDIITKRIKQFHGLYDPTIPGSPSFDVVYNYNSSGQLTSKISTFTALPGVPFNTVTYNYTNGNITSMLNFDDFSGDKIADATLTYNSNLIPKNFMYLFPDEEYYAEYNQFYNFGARPNNAVQSIKVRYYDPGDILTDSTVSTFDNYILSRDNYVVSVNMNGNSQVSIPAEAGKLLFSYKCK